MATQTLPLATEDSISIDRVGGDLAVQGWDRQQLQAKGDGIHVERVGSAVIITSRGDLSLSVPRGVHISLRTIGGDVSMQDLSGILEVGLIGGDATLRNLSGQVQLNSAIGGSTQMENVANVSFNSGSRGPDFDLSEQIRRKVQQATERADRKIRRAQAKMYGVQFDSGHWKYNSGSDATSPAASGEPVSEEERMTILRMLQEKKITAEEAEKLLAALEGGA